MPPPKKKGNRKKQEKSYQNDLEKKRSKDEKGNE